jgi:hypothetical protein
MALGLAIEEKGRDNSGEFVVESYFLSKKWLTDEDGKWLSLVGRTDRGALLVLSTDHNNTPGRPRAVFRDSRPQARIQNRYSLSAERARIASRFLRS